ncbi:LexA family protein [Paenibacillus polymyxa]|uniref:LexA family protein n=1 Tax=Paenibacillus polymyxa TaxID=1406 RepID=UPI0003D397E9|nr:XRE family transcriptional regulator [Paenibacillus polymyxa]
MSENDVKNIFAKNILKLRKNKNLTQKELGEALDLGKTTISQWESAQKLPNAGSIEKIAVFFNIPKSTLFEEGSGQFSTYGHLINLPIVGKISCGNGVIAYQDIEKYEPTPEAWISGGEHFYLIAQGDSMNGARIHSGDLLLIKQQEDIEDGEIAAVLVDDEVFFKRVYKQNDSLILQSENPAYPPIVTKPGNDCFIKVIGKLKKVIINF